MIPPDEVRNQNFLVPTSKGVQKANLKEAKIIENLETKTLENLTKAYILGDAESGAILESHNIDTVLPLASTSKLVAVYVIMDKLADGSLTLDEKVLIDLEISRIGGSTLNLKENQEISVKDLLEATLVISANDAVTALGKYIAGSNEAFVEMMQQKCLELGLTNAHMVNCTGLTNYAINDYNKMTTRELFTLTNSLIKKYPQVVTMGKIDHVTSVDKNGLPIESINTNPILGIVPQIDGLKTGYTNAAGRCLVSTGLKTGIPNTSSDLRLVGVTMGSATDWARFVASRRLMSEAFEKYSNKLVALDSESVGTLEIPDAVPESVEVYPKNPSSVIYSNDQNITFHVNYNPPELPIEEGATVGTITYYL
ncbi:MAG: D-alanyl-D-alanine carboxypeptidase family protein, partial [Gallicola sp.]|nr:D-alanyl-D-alanine carboxypeptidase family protein [Gallicola sp.]